MTKQLLLHFESFPESLNVYRGIFHSPACKIHINVRSTKASRVRQALILETTFNNIFLLLQKN